MTALALQQDERSYQLLHSANLNEARKKVPCVQNALTAAPNAVHVPVGQLVEVLDQVS